MPNRVLIFTNSRPSKLRAFKCNKLLIENAIFGNKNEYYAVNSTIL
jgi:hypothetical protein